MPSSGWEGPGEVRRTPGSGAHTLLVADTGRRRAGTAAWVGGELSAGSKVLYKGWVGSDDDLDGHWLLGSTGADDARHALTRGQLEILDFRTVVARCGGTTDGLFRLQQDEVRSAIAEGWRSVALAQETTYRPLADDAEIAEFTEQERGYGRLSATWPVNTLCQLAPDEEGPTAVRESVALHHVDVVAERWSAWTSADRWHLAGELDISVATEFGAAVHGAFRAAAARDRHPHLHVDLGRVSFLDSACAQIVALAARSAPRRQRLVLHRASSVVRDLFAVVGLPRSVEFDAGGWT